MAGSRQEKATIQLLPAVFKTGTGWAYSPAKPERYGLVFSDGEIEEEVIWGDIKLSLHAGREVWVTLSVFTVVEGFV